MTLGGSFSGAGKARSEFADDGDREHNPRQFGAVSNTCNCCGDAVKVYTLNIIYICKAMALQSSLNQLQLHPNVGKIETTYLYQCF